ncbi:MAG: hypothetical protein Q7R70_03505 [Candidatus Diapherotrites archaeon]|nr:hypothetical protein [Candidatus Diapherotrites archaeon]
MASKSSSVTVQASNQVVGTKLTPKELLQIQRLVDLGEFLGVSDFLRSAVREKLESIEIVQTRNISLKTAKKEVLGYFEKYSEAFPSDAANALSLDLETVHKLTKELIAEKRLEVINND